MTMYSTLLLDKASWDLTVDSSGNIATTAPSYAVAQDVASAVKLFLGELWYDNTKGVPYFQNVLGHFPPEALYNGYAAVAAKTVPGVVDAQSQVQDYGLRSMAGQLKFIDENGEANNVQF